jgi:hypothetical protein
MMSFKIAALLTGLTVPFALSGCVAALDATANAVSTQATVVSATALYFGLPESAITIQNFDQGLLKTKYQATVQGFVFKCKYHYALVTCDAGSPVPK